MTTAEPDAQPHVSPAEAAADAQLQGLHRLAVLVASDADPGDVLRTAAEIAAAASGCAYGAVVTRTGSAYAYLDPSVNAGRPAADEGVAVAAEPDLPSGWRCSLTVPLRAEEWDAGFLQIANPSMPLLPPDRRFLETIVGMVAQAAFSAAGLPPAEDGTDWASNTDIGALLEGMSDPVALVSPDGALRMVNAAYRSLMADAGIAEGLITASPELVHLRDRNGREVREEERALHRALAGRATHAERILRMADGHDRVFALNGNPVLGPGGTINGAALVLRDITEEIGRERALRLMEDLRRGLSLSGDLAHAARAVCRRAVSLLAWVDMAAVYGLDSDELVLQAQVGFPPRAARLLSTLVFGPLHRATQAVLDHHPTIFHADRDEPASEASRRFVVASGVQTFVNLPLVAGTSPFGLIILGSREHHVPSRDELALLEALAGQIGAELEGVRRREQAETERARLQAVLDQLPEGVLMLDEAGRLLMSNRSAQEILGQPVDPSIPLVALASRLGFLSAEGRAYQPGADPIALAFSTGRAVLGEEQIVRRADGVELPVVANVAPVRDAGGGLAAVIMVFQDITSLREMDRMKDEFISIAGHELRTPIASIGGLAQLLLRRSDRLDSDAVKSALATVVDQIEEMGGLVDDLLDMSRIRTGRLSLEFAELDLAVLAEQAAERARLQREPIVTRIIGPLPVSGDRRRLRQVLANLLDNAIKYSERGTPVEISAEPCNGEAVVCVTDHGIGIPEEALDRVFERFYRAENATLHAGGLGLGLYLCREIVERHGGRIDVAIRPGDGSVFTVTLPLLVAAE